MADQPAGEEPTPRNTVTLSLDGDQDEPLHGYQRSQGHFRAWNRYRGIRVDVSNVFGDQREVYTTPSSGTFYYVVRYRRRKLTFVIQARGGWLVGFYGPNGTYQLKLEDQDTPYMNTSDCTILSFKGNHRFISDSDPGSTSIGIYSLRAAFDALWEYTGQNPEPHNIRRSIGIFVVYLCEAAKIQSVFERICRSFSDPSISRLSAESGAESLLGDCCQEWSKLSTEGMRYIHHRISSNDPIGSAIDNRGIQTIVTAEDLLRTIRILHRDAYNQGLFNHEAPPSPPQQWEPIDPGNGDSDSDDENGSDPENDDNDDDDGGWGKGGRKGKDMKYEKRRRGRQRIYRYSSEKKRLSGGDPVSFPDRLLDTWSICPGEIFWNKENEPPASFADPTLVNSSQMRTPLSSYSGFEQGECSSRRPSYRTQTPGCLGEERIWLIFPDLKSLLNDESRNSIMLMKGKHGTKLIVPTIVIQELDCLKQQEGLRGAASKVLSVLKWLQECTEDVSWWIHVQSPSEISVTPSPSSHPIEECQEEGTGSLLNLATLSSSMRSGTSVVYPTTEDYIVQCAVQFKKAERRNEKVVILSDSDTIKAKAKREGLPCEGAKEFFKKLMGPSASGTLCPKEALKGSNALLENLQDGNKKY